MSQSEIERQGFAFWRSALSSAIVVDLIGAIEAAGASGGVYGLRNLLRRSPRVREIAAMLSSLVEPTLGAGAFPTRALLFDKLPRANWLVGWHQDLTIAVRERFESEGFRAWTIKDGVPHVQPPVSVLQNMLTLRLHLDRADAENGALIVLPGTHALGRCRTTGQSRPMRRIEPSSAKPRPAISSPFARSCCTCPARARDQATDASFRSNTRRRLFRPR
jgi:hypothetical protein